MAKLALQGNPANTIGDLPKVGQKVQFSNLLKANLEVVNNETFAGKKKVLNIFPSIDTGVCAKSVREFNKLASDLKDTVVINVSMDLPFALGRFCGAEGIKNIESVSGFRSTFGKDMGLTMTDTALAGLYARAIIVLSPENTVLHTELVADIVQEPNYQAALKALA